jgi:DUF1009 family protein
MATLVKKGIKKLAILAGAGSLPKHVAEACQKHGIEYVVIGFDGEVEAKKFESDPNFFVFKVYALTKIINHLKELGVTHVTMAGKVRRTDLSKLFLDLKGAKLLASIMRGGFADNAVLSAIIKFVEKEGFKVLAPETIATDIVLSKGCVTKVKPDVSAMSDIKQGIKILKGIAGFDVGQALVIQGGLVLGVEAAEGTDALIRRCGMVAQGSDVMPTLIKISKPEQDKRVDLPCIGQETIRNAHASGLRGIAAEAGLTLILDQSETVKLANEYKMFIMGI